MRLCTSRVSCLYRTRHKRNKGTRSDSDSFVYTRVWLIVHLIYAFGGLLLALLNSFKYLVWRKPIRLTNICTFQSGFSRLRRS